MLVPVPVLLALVEVGAVLVSLLVVVALLVLSHCRVFRLIRFPYNDGLQPAKTATCHQHPTPHHGVAPQDVTRECPARYHSRLPTRPPGSAENLGGPGEYRPPASDPGTYHWRSSARPPARRHAAPKPRHAPRAYSEHSAERGGRVPSSLGVNQLVMSECGAACLDPRVAWRIDVKGHDYWSLRHVRNAERRCNSAR